MVADSISAAVDVPFGAREEAAFTTAYGVHYISGGSNLTAVANDVWSMNAANDSSFSCNGCGCACEFHCLVGVEQVFGRCGPQHPHLERARRRGCCHIEVACCTAVVKPEAPQTAIFGSYLPADRNRVLFSVVVRCGCRQSVDGGSTWSLLKANMGVSRFAHCFLNFVDTLYLFAGSPGDSAVYPRDVWRCVRACVRACGVHSVSH